MTNHYFKLLALAIICCFSSSMYGQTQVSDSTSFANAMADLQNPSGSTGGTGGVIQLNASLILRPWKQTYLLSSTSTAPIEINTQQYSITVSGTNATADSTILQIGNYMNIHGTLNVLANFNKGIIRITGGVISSTTTTSGTSTVYANSGWIYVSGGTISMTATGVTNAYALSVLDNFPLVLRGGTISAIGDNTRAVSLTDGVTPSTVKPFSGATITANGNGAYGIQCLGGNTLTIGNNTTVTTTSTNSTDAALVGGGNASSYIVIPSTAQNVNITSSIPYKLDNVASTVLDFRNISLTPNPASGTHFVNPTNVAITASGNSVINTNSIKIYYNYSGGPTLQSTSIQNGGNVNTPYANNVIYLSMGTTSYIDPKVFSFTYSVQNPLYLNVKYFKDLINAYNYSVNSNDTTRITFVATITDSLAFTMTPSALHPINIDLNGFQLNIGSTTFTTFTSTFGGSLKISCSTTPPDGMFRIYGKTTTNITGGKYILNFNKPIIYATSSSGTDDTSTKIYLSNSTFIVSGTSSSANIVKYNTNVGNLLQIDNCNFTVNAKGIAFSLLGPQTVNINNSILNIGSDVTSQAFLQAPASSEISTLTVNGLTLNMTTGTVFTWSGSKTINTVVKDITLNGSSNASIATPAGGTGTRKFYDFRPYTATASLSAGNVTLGLTGTGSGDAAGANLVYSTNGSDPVAGTGVASTVITSAPVVRVAPNVGGFTGKALTLITGTSAASTITNITNNNVTVASGGTLTLDGTASTTTLTNITISAGGKLTLNSGNSLTAKSIALQSDVTGTGTYVDNGTTNITTATVQQYLASGRNWYTSSPVTAATMNVFNSATRVDYYDEPNGIFTALTPGASLTPMTGYVSVSTSATGPVTFSGTLNTGAQSITLSRTPGVTKEGFNLVGNPYPSYVNWDNATKTNLESTMWYRTQNTTGSYVFDTYGATAGQGTNNNGIADVTANIPPMQAFWARVADGQTTGTLAFANANRSHNDVSTNLFRAPSSEKSVQPVLRLKVSNGTNSDEAIVLFNQNATNGFDDYDSPKMTNANAAIPEIYTLAGTQQVVINGLNSIAPSDELPLGFTTGESNTFTIKATEISNFDANTSILLKDNLLNTQQDLTVDSTYSFSSDVASSATRFSLVFKSPAMTTGFSNETSQITVYKNANNQITVHCTGNINGNSYVTVSNAIGQKLVSKSVTSSITVIDSYLLPGVYLVTVNNAGKNSTKKVILN